MEEPPRNPYGAPGVDAAPPPHAARSADPNSPGFWATWRSAAFQTRKFFSRPAAKRSRWGPIWFALVIGAATAPVGALEGVLLSNESPDAAPRAALLALLASPIFTLMTVGVTAAFTHSWLLVLGSRQTAFRETVACVGYTSAPGLFGVVPVIGSIVGAIWQMVALVIAIARVQRISVPRAVIATLAGPLTLVVLALVLRNGVIEAFKNPSGSMLPTLQINDHLFVDKLAYGAKIPLTRLRISAVAPAHGDVAVFESPEHPEQDFIKRVIGLGGDEVSIENGHPIVNGRPVPSCRVGRYTYREGAGEEPRSGELYVEFLGSHSYLTVYEDERSEGVQGPYLVAAGEAFVLGDNRHNSSDSRSWFGGRGAGVPYANFKGRAWRVWMSFDAEGIFDADRFWVHLNGEPRLPEDASPELRGAFEKCLASRPSPAEAAPPRPQ